MRIIGIDEAGRGAWAGPLVAAAVVMRDRKQFPYADVRDSKQLSDAERRRLFSYINRTCNVSVGIVSARLIDRIGIQSANVLAVDRALQFFLAHRGEVHSDYIGSFAKLTSLTIPVTVHIRGEMVFPEIAVASIVAKVFRDDLMLELSLKEPQYSFELHKGYGTERHRQAIKKFGRSRTHRMSFRV